MMHVDAVEQYEYEDRMFKLLQVSDSRNLFSGTIVRGIGHLTSFFPEKLINEGKAYRVEGIRCFWKEDRLMFKYGEKDCDEVYEEFHDYEIEEPMIAGGLSVYPNPTDGIIIISSANGNEYRIANPMGQIIMRGYIDSENPQINVSPLASGLYFITVGNCTRKVVVR